MRTLRVPYAAILIEQDGELELAAERGAAPGERQTVPLAYAGARVGALEIGLRPGDELSASDRLLLGGLARQAGVAVHAVRLTADLQRSREQLVTAREEERRRLRRDLHDGLGPDARRDALQLAAAELLLGRPTARRGRRGCSSDVKGADACRRRRHPPPGLRPAPARARRARPRLRRCASRPSASRSAATSTRRTRRRRRVERPAGRASRWPPTGSPCEALTNVAAPRAARAAATVRAGAQRRRSSSRCSDDGGGLARARPRERRPGLDARARSGARRHLYASPARAGRRHARARPPALPEE